MKSYSGDFELMIASPCCRCDVATLLNLLMSCTRAFIDILPRKMPTKLQAGRTDWSAARNLMGKHARGVRGARGAVHKECMQRKMHTQVDDEDENENENEGCLAWHAPKKATSLHFWLHSTHLLRCSMAGCKKNGIKFASKVLHVARSACAAAALNVFRDMSRRIINAHTHTHTCAAGVCVCECWLTDTSDMTVIQSAHHSHCTPL